MKEIKLYILILFIVTLMYSCNKEADNLIEYLPSTSQYTLVDSVIEVINTFTDSTTVTHYPINRSIDILFSYSKDYLIYDTDTFLLDKTYGYMYHGGLPIINFKNDSISIKQKLGGVGIQTWQYKYGIK